MELILMTIDQGLLVIHLLPLHRVSMATAATPAGRTGTFHLSGVSLEDGETRFATYFCMYWIFTKLHGLVQLTAVLETYQDNTDYKKNASLQ